ncbi:SCP2 sterol-binding domain-containing protein [candidate division KSB1 bacterium]|nr:SCP2 sterol-binding domain-containing protein [candidate division KSB1 bacterium]
MGKYFKTSDEFYKVMVPFFEKLLNEKHDESKFSEFKGTLQLSVTDPDANLVIKCEGDTKQVIGGYSDLKGEVLLKMRGDSVHRLLLGNMVLRDASMSREIIARGPLEDLKKLSSIFLEASDSYKQHLMNIEHAEHIKE